MAKPKKLNQLRIIGGRWRSRKITFPDIQGLRPTPDRIRETLFNWLAPYIVGARCLDLFSGSGALGFEALSRGASHAVMVDESSMVVEYLQKILAQLSASNKASLVCTQIPQYSQTNHMEFSQTFDIIFLDPPFHQGLIQQCGHWLEEQNLLSANAIIYLETEADLDPLPIPNNWQIIKAKKAGNVRYYLAHRIA